MQVIEQSLALTDQLHESPIGGEVLLVDLKVFADVADALGEQRDLSLDRSGVLSRTGMGLENVRFFFSS